MARRDQDPDFAEARINLIDALRDYIRAEDRLTADLLHDGDITVEESRKWHGAERQKYALMLAELESEHEGICLEWLLQNGRRDF